MKFASRWWSGEVEPFDDQTGRFVEAREADDGQGQPDHAQDEVRNRLPQEHLDGSYRGYEERVTREPKLAPR